MLDEALRYADLGMCIIPVKLGTKQPACRSWAEYQTEPPGPEVLRRWFQQPRNLAVVMGNVSGGLVCRDFDEMPAYERWAAQNATLARTLPTVETGRPGRHVYFRCDVEAVKAASGTGASIINFGDGELRAGGYCVLPRSVLFCLGLSLRDDFDVDPDELVIIKVALTHQQTRELDLHDGQMAKEESARYQRFVDAHGDRCWELEAIPTDTLREIADGTIQRTLDMEAFRSEVEIQRREQRELDEHRRRVRELLPDTRWGGQPT